MVAKKKDDDHQISIPSRVSFGKFLYNSDTGEVLGRTGKSWFLILGFYVILYAFLAGFFAGLMTVFLKTLTVEKPTWTLAESIIGTNPGMGFRPYSGNPDDSLISYKPSDPKSVQFWESQMDQFLSPYLDSTNNDHVDNCLSSTDSSATKSCHFDVSTLKDCARKPYGFGGDSPCVYLKLNKIIGWTAESYDKTEIEKNEIGMPPDLRDHISNLTSPNAYQHVWTSCTATSDDSSTNITVTYAGPLGFPNYYFPYQNQRSYQSPLVAVRLHNLPVDTVVRVSCRLWAKNIEYDRKRRIGMTVIEVLMSK